MTVSTPTEIPPSVAAGIHGSDGLADARPQPLSTELQALQTPGQSVQAPTLAPPSLEAVTAGAVTGWVNGQKISALWAINQNRNVWAYVANVGWKKFANNSDSAIQAFAILGSSAKVSQGGVNYREESDGMVHEIYVF